MGRKGIGYKRVSGFIWTVRRTSGGLLGSRKAGEFLGQLSEY
jgi:hypothetical protein